MAILKRINKYQGLKDIDVLVDEKGLSSQYFNITQVPTSFPQGRSTFIIGGSPFLKNNVELKIEILDSKGKTVYTEPITNYLEGDGRRVSVEIYNDTAPGDCFLYVVGELKDNYKSVSALNESAEDITDQMPEMEFDAFDGSTQDVPSEFQDVYNVRYSRPINISTTIPNSEPILFYNQPRVTVSEILKGYVVEVPVSSSVQITGSAEFKPQPNLQPLPPVPEPDPNGFPIIDTSTREDVGKSLEIFKNRRSSKIEPLRFSNFKSRGRIMRRSSPEIDRNEIIIDSLETGEGVDADKASSQFVGGNITINNPEVDFSKLPGDESRYTIPDKYESQISKVKNEKTIVPLDDFLITDNETGERIPIDIKPNTEVTMSYVPTPDPSISTTHFRAFADITLGNLTTFSGDVYKAKISARSRGTLGDFETLYDSTIEAPTVLIDTFSPTGFKNVGYFYTGSIISDYWNTTNGTATIDNSKMIDSVLISGSNQGFTPGVGDSTSGPVKSDRNAVIFATSQSYDLEKNVPYTVSFDAYYYTGPKQMSQEGGVQQHAELEVIVSGSARLGNTNEDYSLGKVEVPINTTEGEIKGIHNTFVSSTTGDPKLRLKFKATAGRWIIHDVEIKPYSETNFNPDYFRTILPMPHPMPKKPDSYDFLVEFFDVNNNIAETIVVKEEVPFAGAPINIDGDGNLLSGSMYLGNTEGSGIEMHGGSAYLRSIGYDGFDNTIASGSGGFLIFSGSVGDRLNSSEDYQGVGLEIVDAHGATNRFMKFRTDPSTFQVQTDEFFLGSTSQFVSGSNGNIEISSSNFHLSPDGDVTMAGTISATAGNIGDFQIVNGQISGSNITMNATRSQIFKTDQGPGSDTSAVFESQRDEYYIDFTPSESIDKVNNYRPGYYIKMGPNFMVDKDGILIASGATFEGSITASAGLIGGFTTDSHSFSSNNIFISGSPEAGGIDDSKYMFISTSNFNVKQDGSVTGSEFLLEGGTITDGVTILGSVSANSILTPATIGGSPSTAANASSSIDSQGFAAFRSASIAGWVIDPTSITDPNSQVKISSDTGVIALGSTVPANLSSNGIFLTGSGEFNLQVDSNNFIKNTSSGFQVKTEDLNIDTTTLDLSTDNGGKITLGTAPALEGSAGIFLSGSGEFNFEVDSNNLLRQKDSTFTIKSQTFSLTGTNLELSNNKFNMGTLSSATDVGDTSTGFHVDSSGNVLIKQGGANAEYLQFNGGGIDIKAGTFDLETSNLVLDSGTNDGKLSMGATPPTAYNSGTGIYFDGTGKALIGASGGDKIQFDGSNFTVQVGSLELDATNIEISSANASMSLGEGNILLDGSNNKIKVGAHSSNNVEIVGSSTQGYIATGKTSATSTTAGFWLANNNSDPEFHVGDASNFVKFDGGNFNLASENLEISSSTIQISTAESSMSFGHDNTATDGKIIIEGKGTPSFRVGPDAKNLSLTAGSGVFIDGAGNFKFGDSDGNVTFDGGSFSITGSDVAINVTDINISSSGFEVSSTEASMSLGTNKQWLASGNGVNPFLSIGQTTAAYDNTGIFLGYVNSVSRPKFSLVGSSGHLKFDDGIDIATTTFELDTPGLEISNTQQSMSIGPSDTNPITLQSNGDDRSIRFGSKTDFDQTTTAGFIMGIDNGNAKFDFTIGSSNNNYIRMSSGGVDIKTPNFLLDTTNLDINSATSRIVVSDGSNERVRIGEISDSASDLYGMKIYDGSGTADSNTLVKLGEEGNEIAGWTITNDRLSGGKMIIRQDGTIESDGFASNVAGSGFRLTADQGGFLEVENARIRGTMSTAVFEKESVNAVGGQLYVANSTTLATGSIVTAAETTMSVENVTGFVANEILSAKKVDSSGFATEYLLVNSASRDNPSSETDFKGKLFVTRAYGSGTTGDSGSLGDTPSSAQFYSGSQVLVSTGRENTGYIRLNANPNDVTTPYIDIVERTGSAIYDVELKARLGDLSGLSSGLLYGNTNPGFGLFTENVFLSGAITATTGSFTGIVHIGTSPSEEMRLGTDVSSTNDGLHINNNNYWYTTGAFKVGSSNYYLSNDSSGNISIQPKELTLQVSDGSGGHKFELAGTATEQSMSFNNEDVVIGSDGSRGFARIGRNTAKAIFVTGSQALGAIRIAKDSFTDDTAGFWLANDDGTPQFYIGNSSSHLKFDGSNISLSGDAFNVTASNVDISTGTMLVDADDFQINSTTPSMSLGYDSNSNVGMEFVGGSTTTIKFGPKASPKLLLQSDTQDAFMRIGSQTFGGTDGGIIIGSDNGTAKLDLYTDANNYFRFDDTQISIRTNTFDFQGTNLALNNTRFYLGTITSDSDTSGAGVYMDNGGAFRVQGDTTNFIRVDGGSLSIGSDNLNIDTAKGDIVFNSGTQRISMGASPPTDFSSNGIIISGSGYFNFQKDGSNYIKHTSSGFDIKAANFDLDATTILMDSGTNSGTIKLGASATNITNTANTGIYMDGTGKFRVGTATSGTDYFYFDGSSVDIKTQALKLDTSNLDIDSAAGGSGSIALGSTPPTAYDSGNGFFVDGSGKFLLGNTSGNHISWDGSNVTLVGTLRQTTGGATITDYVDRGTWSGASTSYNENDLVQYSGSTYKCINAHTSTNDTNATTGRPDTATNSWAVYAAGGSDGAAGSDAKTVSLTASSLVIEYNAAGDNGSGTITLTATSQNFTDAYFKFTGGGGAFSDEGSYTDGSGANGDTATFTIPTNYSSTPYTFTVSVQEGSSGGEVASDTITIASIKPGSDGSDGSDGNDGADAYTVILTNESHTLPTTNGGVVTYTGSGTSVVVYKGATELNSVTGTPGSGEFKVTSTATNITAGAQTVSGNPAVFADHSSCTQNTANVSYAVLIENTTTITKIQSISKANQGSDGSDGSPAKTVSLTAPNVVVVYDAAGSNPSPSGTLTLTATSQNFTNGFFKFTGDGLTDETSYIDGSGANADTFSYTIPSSYFSTPKAIRVGVAEGDQSEVAFDTMTLSAVQPGADGDDGNAGADAYTIILDNESHTVPQTSDQAGAVRDLTNSGTNVIVYKGATELASVSGTPSTNQFKVTATGTNITPGSIGVSGNPAVVADHSSMNADTATIGYDVNVENSVTFAKSQSFSTAQAADSGSDGSDGAAGSNAKNISVSANSLVFVKAQAGTLSPSSVTITANGQNLTQAGSFSTTAGTLTSTTENSSGGSTTVTSGNFSDGMVVTYTTHGDDGSLTDSVTLKQLDEGSGTVSAILSNEAHVFPATTAGAVSSYSNSGTTIKVFEGATALTFTTGTPAAGQFAVSVGNTANITEGSVSGNGTNTCTIADHSGAADGTDEYVITYTITGKTANGTSFTSFTKTQSLSKSKTGSTGAAGSDSKTVSLSASSQVIEYNAAGGGGSGTITLTATSQNFTDAYFKFTGGGGAFSDESSYSDGSGANADTATFTIPSSYSSTPYTFTVSVQEGSSGGEVASDTVTIASIKPGSDGDDGVDALTIVNSNPTHTLPASDTGVVSSYANSGTTIQVYEGTTQLDYDGSGGTAGHFTVATSQSPSSTITIGGVSDSTNDAVVANHSSMVNGTDNVLITYTITGKRLDGTSLGTLTTTQTIGKNKSGATGGTGAAGAGVVFRGVYSASKTYFHTSARKDLVEGSDGNYYIVNNTGDNNTTNWDNPVGGSDWTSFGAQFSSVATDILLAQDVFAERTVNIGADGSTPVIALDADDGNSNANPFIGINSTAYDANNGIFLGFHSGTGKVSIKNSDGSKYFRWTGAALEVDAGNFTIDSSGDITATNVDLTGEIKASTGTIGGFNIGTNKLQSTSGNFIVSGSSGQILLGGGIGDAANRIIHLDATATAGGKSGDEAIRLSIGNATQASAPFQVNAVGAMTASNAEVTGKITAQSGTIGGFDIGSTLSAGSGNKYIELVPSTPKIRLGAKTSISDSNTGVHIGDDGIALGASSVFKVTSGGVITAESGTIGGWTLANDKLSAGTDSDYIALIPGTGIQMGDSTFADAEFSVTNAGVLKASSGTVGGWTLSPTTLSSNNVSIDSAGKIRMGSSLPSSATSGTGFYADDDSFMVGSSSGNRIQKTSAGAIILQSSTFALSTSTINIDSGTNSGKIQLGASGGPTSNATGQSKKGIYFDGTGDLLVSNGGAGSAEGYIKFDASAGTFELQTSSLKFEADGNITSQDFLVERSRLFGAGADGDVTLTTGTNQSSIASTYDSHNSTANLWTLARDAYADDLTINSSVTLDTNGYRIFVKGTLTNNGTIRNNGSGATSKLGAAGATSANNLKGGSAGTNGGNGGSAGTGGGSGGGDGGGAGGGGGIILIFCRNYTGSGEVDAKGGDGADGGGFGGLS